MGTLMYMHAFNLLRIMVICNHICAGTQFTFIQNRSSLTRSPLGRVMVTMMMDVNTNEARWSLPHIAPEV